MNNPKILRFKNIKKVLDKIFSNIPFFELAFRLFRHPKKIANIAVIRDYLKLKNNFNFIKQNKKNVPNKKILIVSLTDFIYQIKLEAMLAKALQLSGCEISILTWGHCLWAKKYFRLFGIDKFVYFENYLDKFRKYDFDKELKAFLNGNISFQTVKRWKYKQCFIGQDVLSSLVRCLYGTPNLLQHGVYELLIGLLKQEMKCFYATEVLLRDVKPQILLFKEVHGITWGTIFDSAFNKGLDIIQFIQPFRDDALIFKRFNEESFGLHPNSLSKSTFDKIKSMPWTEKHEEALWNEFSNRYRGKWFLSHRNQMGKVTKDKDEIITKLGIDMNKKIVTIFSQILWDANLFYGEDIFEDYEDWFIETIKTAYNNPKVNWIIKLHPANIWKRNLEGKKGELREITLFKERIGKPPKHVYLLHPHTDINTFSLFNLTDYGITVRGTSGMELPCFGKPVFTAGTGRYSGLGFTIDSSSKEEYLTKLSKIQNFPPLTPEQTLLAKKHAYAVFNLRPWIMRSFKANFKYKKWGRHPLDHNLSPIIDSFEELSNAEDLKKFSEWVLTSNATDYLEDGIK